MRMLTSNLWSPLRRNLCEPLLYLLNGSPRLQYWKKLERTQFLPEKELKQIQWRRLTDLLWYAWDNNNFYRSRLERAGLTPDRIQTPEDLCNIPILTKEEIRQHTSDMISRGYSKDALIQFKTGGSTGKSLQLYITEECSEMRNACARRHDRWTGWEVGEPVGAVWGNPVLPSDLKSRLQNWLLTPFIYLDTMNVTDNSVLSFAQEWKRVHPTMLFGHAHSLYILAEYVRKLGISQIRPKGILSTSMMLMPHERKLIEEVFGVKVTDRYGCEEVSLIASECEKHEGMHLNIEHLYIEFIKDNGTHAAPGEPGRIVVTDLMNRAMPFIRYAVEDVGVLTARKCSCGRGLPLMEHVTGRVADFLLKKDGSKVAGVSLIENTLTKIPGIDQMQIVQKRLDTFIIRVVAAGDNKAFINKELESYFITIFGKEISITIEHVNTIPSERSGKYRFSICEIV